MGIRVANIILDGRFGGPQNQILQVAKRLKEDGFEPIVIIPRKDSDIFHDKLVENEIRVERLNLHRFTGNKLRLTAWLLFFVPELFSLRKVLRRRNIRLVHCNTSWQIKGILAAKLAGAKVIWHLHDTEKPKFVKIIVRVLTHLFCDGLILAGDRAREYYLNGHGIEKRNGRVIQAPVDTSYFNPQKVAEDTLVGKSTGLRITSVGNINPAKGFEYFVEMAHILHRKYSDLYFFIVGPHIESQKRYWEELNRLVSQFGLKNLFFYGKSDNVASILKATDVYVCSSVTEASPMSVWEAMAMEKAVVSTNVGDVGRFIQHGENGFIVPPRSAQALAEKVGVLIENQTLRKEFGKRARTVAIKELDIGICVERHKCFYREVLSNPRKERSREYRNRQYA